VAVLSLLAVYIADKSENITQKTKSDLLTEIMRLPEAVEKELHTDGKLKSVAEKLYLSQHIYFIGRNTDYALAVEGSLKLKEISYIHSEAYAAGELKHGTISLIEKDTPVVAVCLREDIASKTLSNIKEVKARGARVIIITKNQLVSCFDDSDTVICLKSDCSDMLSVITGVVPLQLLSYEVALRRGCEIDKPRNLAKSVTVE
jgi:glucosamine--fructose-6-phosphate aminotransferase (isomerizing)